MVLDRPIVLLGIVVAVLVGLYLAVRLLRFVGRVVRSAVRSVAGALPGVATPSGGQKYDDPEAQQAHEDAQRRDLSSVVPVGETYTTVVRERMDRRPGTQLRVKVNGVQVFVDEKVPDGVSEGDTIRIRIADHAASGTAAHAIFEQRV